MDVPQIDSETGISGDYWNEWGGITFKLMVKKPVGEAKLQMIADYFKKTPVPTYEEKYKNCENIITEQNSESIKKLDALVKKANSFTAPEKFTEVDFEKLINDVYAVMYPGKKPYFPRE